MNCPSDGTPLLLLRTWGDPDELVEEAMPCGCCTQTWVFMNGRTYVLTGEQLSAAQRLMDADASMVEIAAHVADLMDRERKAGGDEEP